jgi:hypothetical protein
VLEALSASVLDIYLLAEIIAIKKPNLVRKAFYLMRRDNYQVGKRPGGGRREIAGIAKIAKHRRKLKAKTLPLIDKDKHWIRKIGA